MPFQKDGKRDYKREAEWEKTRKRSRLKDRVKRVQARRDAIAEGRVRKGDSSKQLDHKHPISKGGSNSRSNLRVVPASSNMSFSRNSDGSMKSQKSKRERSR
jgi:5-methylcytosine-specific restriction endonuclease McrA